MSAPANKRAKVSASGIPSLFNDLAKIGVAESIVDASWKIIKELELCQEQFSPSETDIVEESDESMLSLYSGGELGALLSPDVIYALKRCIKGTASGEQTTRLAFSTCFTLLLTRFKMNILVPVVWKWINALLSPSHLFGTSSLSRSEQTLVYTSKLGSILALIEADILHDQVEVCLEIVSELAGIAKSRSFLRLSALNAMKDLACLNMNAEKVTDLIEELPLSADLIFVFDDLLEKKRKFKELLPEIPLLNNYGLITDLLIDTISISSDMHPLWTKMLDHFANNPTSIDLFWKSQIDSKLFSSDSVEKRLIGFKLSDHLFESHSLIIFSDNFIQNFESLAINLTIKGKKDLPLTQSVKRLVWINFDYTLIY